jgi:two-component system chemotaxis sensor kinase CheA
MIVDALLVEVGGQQMAVPQPVLREVVRVDAAAVTGFERNDVISHRGGVLPLLSLRRLFNLPDEASDVLHLLVVGSDASPTGLVVDRLLGLREIVVHPVTDPLIAMPGVGGATELGDGRVSLVLDSAALVRMARERREQPAPAVA